jgi:hypothetical protein
MRMGIGSPSRAIPCWSAPLRAARGSGWQPQGGRLRSIPRTRYDLLSLAEAVWRSAGLGRRGGHSASTARRMSSVAARRAGRSLATTPTTAPATSTTASWPTGSAKTSRVASSAAARTRPHPRRCRVRCRRWFRRRRRSATRPGPSTAPVGGWRRPRGAARARAFRVRCGGRSVARPVQQRDLSYRSRSGRVVLAW